MDGTSTVAATEHSFMVNETNPELLSIDKAELFHHNMDKLLFLCHRGRPYLQTAVALLTTCVQSPD